MMTHRRASWFGGLCGLGVLVTGAGAQDCGTLTLTQNDDPTIVTNTGLGCEDQFTGVQVGTSYARSYETCVTDLAVNCVDFAIEFNTVGGYEVTINLYRDDDGGDPVAPGMDLTLLGSGTTTIPVVLTSSPEVEKHYTVDFTAAPIIVSAGTILVVELVFPDRSDIMTGDMGMIRAGCNNTGETAPSYILAPACLVPTYVTVNSLGFPDAMLIQEIDTDPLGPLSPCPADCAGADGVVNIDDFLGVLGQWGLPGQPCDITGMDDTVDIDDFLALLGAWGDCPGMAPFCEGDTNQSFAVDIDDFLAVLGSWGVEGCTAADVDFNEIVNIDDFLTILGNWGPCP